jgi:HSP20 family molecular chaperone IbpA
MLDHFLNIEDAFRSTIRLICTFEPSEIEKTDRSDHLSMLARCRTTLSFRPFFHTVRDGPLADILKTPTGFQVQLELPGIRKEDVHVDVHKNVLHVNAVKQKIPPAGSKLIHSERKFGSVTAQFSLPVSVDVKKLEAVLEEGVLTLSIPVAESDTGKVQIKVQ